MKEDHKQVVSDFKNGHIQWKDLSMSSIRDLGRNIMKKVLTSTEDFFVTIRDSIFKGVTNDINSASAATQKAYHTAAQTASNLANKIFRSVGGGGKL